MTEKNFQSSILDAVEKFNALDDSTEQPIGEIQKALWIPSAVLLGVGFFAILIKSIWLPVIFVLGILLWNILAQLSFENPILLTPALFEKKNMVYFFHFISRSKRVVFIALPIFFVILFLPAWQKPFLAWSIALILLWPLRILLGYSEWLSRSDYDRDYTALGISSLIGFICFFWPQATMEIPLEKAQEKTQKLISTFETKSSQITNLEEKQKEIALQINSLKEAQVSWKEKIVTKENMENRWNELISNISAIQEKMEKNEEAQAKQQVDLLQQAAILQEKTEKLEKALVSSEDNDAQEKTLTEQKEKLQNLETTLQNTAKSISQISQQKETLEQLSKSQKELAGRFAELENSTQASIQKNKTLQQQIALLQQEQSALQLIDKIRKENQALTSELKAKNEKLKEQVTQLEKQNPVVSLEPSELEKENLNLKEKIRDLEKTNDTLKKMQKAQKDIQFLFEEENKSLKQKLDELKQEEEASGDS